jgi:hypothetical protein
VMSAFGVLWLYEIMVTHEYEQENYGEFVGEIFGFTAVTVGVFACIVLSLGFVRGAFRSLRRYRRRSQAESGEVEDPYLSRCAT